MKNVIIAVLLLAVVSVGFGQTAVYSPNYQGAVTGRLLGGEHTWVILRGTGTFTKEDAIDSISTAWFKCSVSDSNSSTENGAVFDFDADIMNLDVNISSAGDSVGLSQIRVEWGWDNTGGTPIRNADSTFTLMYAGNSSLALYAGNGGWLYETPSKTAHGIAQSAGGYEDFQWRYKVAIQGAAWCKITFLSADDLADDVVVKYTISMTH